MSQQRRLTYVLILNACMIGGLVIVGLVSHSISVLAAGGDFVADSLAIALGLFAVYRRDRHGDTMAPTYVAFINASLLLIVTGFVLVVAIKRLVTHNPEVLGLPVFLIALVSSLAMLAGVAILGMGSGNEDLHMRSVLLDTMADGVAAGAVAVVGLVIFATHGLDWLDSAVAIAISLVIGYGAIDLLVDVVKALRRRKPIATEHA
jgi:cobalt-zinc-cadmium efflux system protein